MGGVQPNPVDTKVYEGIEICRREQADLLLPVGGGSVIDTAKAIAAGANVCMMGSMFAGCDESPGTFELYQGR